MENVNVNSLRIKNHTYHDNEGLPIIGTRLVCDPPYIVGRRTLGRFGLVK